jgi:hypothetical protein
MDDDILENHRRFDDAELHARKDVLDSLLADDFLSIGERGFVLDKQQWIGRLDDFRYLTLATSETNVRRYGQAAILRCAQRSTATWQGASMSLAVRLSQVWVWQSEGWRLAGIQFSSLPDA